VLQAVPDERPAASPRPSPSAAASPESTPAP
jgi:hypothetical protein